jgi:predicted enzyme related to lactoylglutathione lyase
VIDHALKEHRIASREERLAARNAHLKNEKALTRLRDLVAKRPRRRCFERLEHLEQSTRRTIMSKMNSVVHFEMPYDDRERMAKFYQIAFGWQTQMFGEEMGNYVLATTTETDESGPKKPGAINGGFFPKRPDWPAQHPSLVIAVDDIQAAIGQVAKAGGEVLGEPMDIPGVGQYVSFFDTERNRMSMLQPIPRNRRAPKT